MARFETEGRGDAHGEQGDVCDEIRAEDHVPCRTDALADAFVVVVGIGLRVRPDQFRRRIGVRLDATALGAVGVSVFLGARVGDEEVLARAHDANAVIDGQPARCVVGGVHREFRSRRVAGVRHIVW